MTRIGRTILITGASRGVGKALVWKFLAEGDFVIGSSIGMTFISNNGGIVGEEGWDMQFVEE